MKGVMSVIRKDGKYLLGIEAKECPAKGKWRLLGGRAEDGETPASTLEREIGEEGGISLGLLGKLGERQGDYEKVLIDIFLADYIGGTLREKKDEILNPTYFSLKEIEKLDMDNITRSVFEEYKHII